MREIVVQGKVRRVESGTYQGRDGVVREKGSVVLDTEFDKLEIGLGMDSDKITLSKLARLVQGQDAQLLVGVMSGDSFRADARFIFLDDLTAPGK